jgi:MFS family permease
LPGYSSRLKIFYGYWVLTACFVLNVICSGCGPISFSFFVTSLQRSLDWSRTEIMTAFTVFFICLAIGQPLAGRLVHRYGSRRVIVLGALLSAVGYFLVSQMNSLWQYYLSYSLIGFGVAASGPVITTLVVSNWFVRRRGMAIGAISMGAGTAGLLFTPVVIVYMLPNLGWSNTFLVFAAITALISIPLAAMVIRTRPADIGLLPDGGSPSKIEGMDSVESPAASGLPFKQSLSTGAFWLLAAAILFVSTHMGVMQNQIPHLEDLGFTAGIVASTMSIVAIVSAIGPLVFGWLSDRITVKNAGIIAVVSLVISIILLLYVDVNSSPWFVWAYAVMLGLGVGGWMTAMSLLTSSNFGLVAYGTIYGVLSAFQSIGGAIAPIFSGYFYDSTGSYHRAFITMLIIITLGIPAILGIRRPKPIATDTD